jgi:glycosyltransferase involved in cell wall biosynthesis
MKPAVRIVHVIVGLGVGGAEGALCRLVSAHAGSERYLHSVVSLTDKGTLSARLEEQGISVQALGLCRATQVPRTFFALRRALAANDPDIVQCWMYHADLLGGLAAFSLGKRSVIWGIRNSKFESGGTLVKKAIRGLCALLSYVIPRRIVCVAESARALHARVGYDARKMVVIPNGFDLGEFRPDPDARARIRTELRLGDGNVVIGSVGRYSAAKDHATFLAAAAMVAETRPAARFLLVGRDLDTGNAELARLISKHGLADKVRLAGERHDVAACMAAMDVFCLHSQTEGFPNVLGEAMGCALPVVSTDAGDAGDIVGDCGVVVAAGDWHALGEALGEMAGFDEAERIAAGAKARARIQARYAFRRIVADYEALYEAMNG